MRIPGSDRSAECDALLHAAFDQRVRRETGRELQGVSLETIQVNIGLRCNLACHHCHVESSPAKREEMSWETMQLVLEAAGRAGVRSLDITGGAPEMHPRFREFVDRAVEQRLEVIVRTNLTIMLQLGFENMPRFLADRNVHLVASLPCYLESNVDRQRGKHVYRDSIDVILRLNGLGYGIHPSKELDLIYNPGGPDLPPPQEALEFVYRGELLKRFGIRFNRLYTITNMPIGRFLLDLRREGVAESYMQELRGDFNPGTIPALMCRHQIHVGWDGTLYDCDFNYGIGLPVSGSCRHVRDFDPDALRTRQIVTGGHCFGCTAGCGSSCKGSLVSTDSCSSKEDSR
ncbi:MAG: arsenosugar biosynthesis radical SAM protein ArsS [Planctomycetes bacterium]|nr:arsenosugar biosynthesis radical SAM protein ArsS [Planctomycetota bacterium]